MTRKNESITVFALVRRKVLTVLAGMDEDGFKWKSLHGEKSGCGFLARAKIMQMYQVV